jgi:subtilisin family serine protease
VVVVSAGNLGSLCGTVRNPPAIYQQSFSVANYNHWSDLISGSSSRGPVTYGGETYTKPDIAAPGTSIRSSIPGGSYGALSGTSMAAPHVAGAVALLLSAAPGYVGRVAAIEQILTSTAEPRTTAQGCGGDGPGDVPNNVWGWGIVDALAAVQSATAASLQGMVAEAEGGAPIAAADVTASFDTGVPGPQALTGPTGHYSLTLAAATYRVTADAFGYLPQTVTGVVVISGEVTTLDLALVPAEHVIYLPFIVKLP